MQIAQKVAIVTGGGGGIGGALAERLAAEGARVVVSDLDAASAQSVVDRITATSPGAAIAVGADASDTTQIASLISAAESEFGPVDLYFANAGVAAGSDLEFDDAVWDLALDVNVRAHIRAARLLIPGWVERGEGYFVSTASAAGLLTQIGSAPYSVSKHAAVGFAEWLSVTYGDQGVRVSCLCPMGVNTKLLTDDAALSATAARAVTTAGAVLEPADVAECALAAIEAEQFLILPHPEVLEMYRHKGADYDRWIRGMRRYQAALLGQTS
ncbi:SDR family oxidoreductase [Rhodococcus oxybenzonivorans]|uniref:SDR family oxidoreductase n=1 Tax=Rhodococcus oxybenzonivorans TaxID=1990687 RepID=UPI0029555D0B|nr:SDR family oxidoreductase [Rhodococcus oxybenzonivorans]MDV7352925.1 SDR family oxidoreductase [Rhodococcus oxybenzonivorans]